jgi:HTH-type transcriptional regulator/antitoxin HigA
MMVRAADTIDKAIPTIYAELVRLWMPRTIHSQEEADKAWKAIEPLVLADLTEDQDDYLDTVSNLIAAYEEERFPHLSRKLSPVEMLRLILEETGMSASNLGRLLGDRSVVSAILTGRRQLSKNHIRILCEKFKLDPLALLEAGPRKSHEGAKRAARLRRSDSRSPRQATRGA